jgi:hypothetical protein
LRVDQALGEQQCRRRSSEKRTAVNFHESEFNI